VNAAAFDVEGMLAAEHAEVTASETRPARSLAIWDVARSRNTRRDGSFHGTNDPGRRWQE
jgi:hypothetical protein